MSSRRNLVAVVSAPVVLFLVAFVNVLAQGPAAPSAPQRLTVTITQVIPQQLDAFIAHVRDEGIPAEKKSGLAWRATYREVFGELNTFVTVRPAKLGDFDQPSPFARVMGQEASARYLARQRQYVSTQSRIVVTLQPELSIQSGMTTPAPLLMQTQRKLLAGRANDYNQLVTSQVLPAYRKAGVKDYWSHTVMFGAPQSRVVVRPIANVAELDVVPGQGLLAKALGAEAALKLNQQIAALTESVETKVLRLVPELSFSQTPQRTSR